MLAATILACAPGAAPSLALLSIVRVVQGNSLGPVIGALTIGAIAGVFGWSGGIGPMLTAAVAGAASGLSLLRESMGRRCARRRRSTCTEIRQACPRPWKA
ncbi:hypothetical protein [Burkholderia cenocepacia]|uniref:hypothetical protein n=1 Tax=Burkholderia cenocepacia TaxID=95486 RepID=UPI00390CC404